MTARRVLFDGYWLADGPPSGKNVVFGLSSAWAQEFPEDDIVVTYPEGFREVALPAGVSALPLKARVANHGVWTMTRIGREAAGFDAILTQNFTPMTGSAGATRVTFLHDAMYKDRPQWFTPAERAYLSFASAGISRAHRVITSSEAERSRIQRVFPTAASRVHAVGLAASLGITDATPSIRTESEVDRPFVLAVGRLNVRKNLARLIDGFISSGVSETHDLRIVGAKDGRTGAYHDHNSVHFLGGIDDASLAILYRTCDFFAFPSLDEGFGLPLVEASHFGAPSVASDIPPFREIGAADVFFDPTDSNAIAIALRKMATAHGRRARTTSVASTDLSWARTARLTRSAIFE